MCSYYETGSPAQLGLYFGDLPQDEEWRDHMSPLYRGVVLLPSAAGPQLITGQWGMIPPHSETNLPKAQDGKRLSTFNARREGMAKTWTYRNAWRKGQRCLIPAQLFVEPYWGTGKHIPWQFERPDGTPWALAGLWDVWIDPETGEEWTSYTMITQNADNHPLMRLMHRPDPKRPPDKQDKRAVVPIERADWGTWLNGTIEQAEALIKLPPVEAFKHRAHDPTLQVELPITTE